MDNYRKMRVPVRAAVTRNLNLLDAEMGMEAPDRHEIDAYYAVLEEKFKELDLVDQAIQELLIQVDAPEEEYARECEAIDGYKEKLIRARLKVETFYKKTADKAESVYADAESMSGSKKKFRLPKLELPKFGELKDWLCFWGLFKKIHEDEGIEAVDKFQYLLQAISPGSRARELIDSYPPTAENYPKVVESLRQRFGRDDLLVEVYVRDLLRLVLHNASNPKEKVTITKLYDQLESHIRALDTLGVTSDKCAAMLYPLVESCLPEEVLRVWQRGSVSNSANSDDASKNRLTNLLQFLRSEVEGEERIRLARSGFGLKPKPEKQVKEKEAVEDAPTAAGLFSAESQPTVKSQSCIFCEKRHVSQDCFQAQKMTIQDKKSSLQKRRGCFVCLKSGHMGKDCKHAVKCIICSQRHYPIMCPDLPQKKEQSHKKECTIDGKPSLANVSSSPEVLLKTLIVKINVGGRSKQARVIIDDGSHRSYILKRVAEETGLNPIGNEPIIHALSGGVKTGPVQHYRYNVPLESLDGSCCCNVAMLDQTIICTSVPKVPRGPWLSELKQRNIRLSDVGYGTPEIEILLGADVAGTLMTGTVCHLNSGLVAVETKLGWTLMGEVPGGRRSEAQALLVHNLLNSDTCISNFWKLETLGITDPSEVTSRAELERAAKNHFQETVRVNEEGRYEVHLPWLEGHPKLPTNKALAERRLVVATNKLKSMGYIVAYGQVFQEWMEMGIIERVPESELGNFGHYLAHRAVVKSGSSTTKIRPVFDASAHEKNSPCLNDCLEKGPNLMEKLPTILLRFREKRIGVVSDIAKAFLQLSLVKRDREFMRFLWWEDPTARKYIVLRHRRVVFGVSSSPFLLGAVIEHHLNSAPDNFRPVAELLKKAFYVDNVAISVNSESEQIKFMQEAQDLMAAGKFDLRGWEHTLLSDEDTGVGVPEVPLFGLVWDKRADTLRCESILNSDTELITKRRILGVAHKIFDPIGFTSPATLEPKKLLQMTWECKIGWDTEVPSEISGKFKLWAQELDLLSQVKVPRWIIGNATGKENWTINTFSDASRSAYAACVFVRAVSPKGVSLQLVLAKSPVAPIKQMTIPRLELLSCLVGVRLTEVVKNGLDVENVPITYWSDSSTALSWIRRDDQWGTFVGNRVKEIRSFSDIGKWRHVPGNKNPADLPSRGCSIRYLLESKWWQGPAWLRLPVNQWPNSTWKCDEAEVCAERRKTVTSMLCQGADWSVVATLFKGIHSYSKIIRRIAWYGRFFKWLKVRLPSLQYMN